MKKLSANRWLILLGFLGVLCVSLTSLSSADDKEKVLCDTYYDVYLNDALAGRTRHVVKEVSDGKPTTIVTRVFMEMKIARLGMEISIEEDTVYRESPDGQALGFKQVQKVSEHPTETVGEIKETKVEGQSKSELTLTTISMGKARARTMEWQKDALLPYAGQKLYEMNKFEKGKNFSYKTFMIGQGNDFTTCTVKMLGTEKIKVDGKEVELNKYSSSLEAMPGVETVEWRDDKCELIRSEIPLMGMKITIIRSTKPYSKLTPAELTAEMLIPCSKTLSPTNEVTYRLTAKKGELNLVALEDNRQKINKKDNSGIILQVRWVLPDHKNDYEIPYSKEGLEEYQQDNALLQCADKELKETARQIAGKEKSAWKVACLIEQWVYDNIKEKNYSVGFASAAETLKTREGDCTEHGILLAALARAAGIPSRLVSGVTYVEIDKKPYFGYHMWTEVFVGTWIALDGTRPKGGLDARYISLAKSSLKDGTIPPAMFVELIKVFGNLEIAVVEPEDKP